MSIPKHFQLDHICHNYFEICKHRPATSQRTRHEVDSHMENYLAKGWFDLTAILHPRDNLSL